MSVGERTAAMATVHGEIEFVETLLPLDRPAGLVVHVCQTCHSVVFDRMKHARWHGDLRDALLGAGSPWGPGAALTRV